MCQSTEEAERILQKWIHPYRRSYTTVNGHTFPAAYKIFKEAIDNFEVFDDDIWICSYPKTGTTWISELVWLIVNNFDYERAKKNSMYDRIRFLDLSMFYYAGYQPEIKVPDAVEDSITYAKNQPRPRFIKSHLPLQFLPKQLRTGEKQPKVVYITRNPTDACVSYYHHGTSMGFNGTMEEFYKLYLSNKMVYGSFWHNVLPFWQIKDKSNILFLKFEDMKKDLTEVIHQTAAFLGQSVPQEQMENLRNYLSFDSMKNNEAVNGGVVWEFLKSLGTVKSSHIRSGTVGGYKKDMPQKYINLFQTWIEDNTAGTGLTF